MYERVIYEDPFSTRYLPDQYTTHQMCDQAVYNCLPASNFFS